jgi:hypothetical protein
MATLDSYPLSDSEVTAEELHALRNVVTEFGIFGLSPESQTCQAVIRNIDAMLTKMEDEEVCPCETCESGA